MAADLIGILGQNAPGAATNADAYTVPASRVTVLSSIVVCNTGAATTYRVHARINGAAAAVGNALFYDVAIPANSTDIHVFGLTLGDTDVITTRSASGGVTFTVSGEETDVPT